MMGKENFRLLAFVLLLLAVLLPSLSFAATCTTTTCSTDVDCSAHSCGVCSGGLCTAQAPGPLACETFIRNSGTTPGYCTGQYSACGLIAPGSISLGECGAGAAYNACLSYYSGFPSSYCTPDCGGGPCGPSDPWDCVGNKIVSCSIFNNNKQACEFRSGCTWNPGGGGSCPLLSQVCSTTNPCCSGQSLTCGVLGLCCYDVGAGSCSSDNDCCLGLTCDPTSHTCGVPLCRTITQSCTGPGQGTCCNGLSCNPTNHTCVAQCTRTTACSSNNECCPGSGFVCSGRGNCCKTLASSCDVDADCCSGKCYGGSCVNNKPPLQPAAPFISVEDVSPTQKSVGCTFNCPPSPLPSDPEGDDVHMEYYWQMDGSALGSFGPIYDLPCDTSTCPSGSEIILQSRSCDSRAECSSAVSSNQRIIFWAGTGGPSGTLNLSYFIYAFIAALSILALAFMVSYVFHLPHLRAILQDELLQVLSTVAVAFLLLALNAGVDNFSGDALAATGYSGTSTTMIGAAQNVLGGLEGKASSVLGELTSASTMLGAEASRGIFCNFLGVGFTLINCSPLNAFRGSITMSSFTTAIALADTYAQQFILSMAYNYAFTFIIPLGLFLRCFKTSRQAGGALVAIGFGFYTVYPTVIVATEASLHGNNPNSSPGMPSLNPSTCDPREADVANSRAQFADYAVQLTDEGRVETFAYLILVRVVFLSILNLIITLGFIRELARLLGSDIDVSALARIT